MSFQFYYKLSIFFRCSRATWCTQSIVQRRYNITYFLPVEMAFTLLLMRM